MIEKDEIYCIKRHIRGPFFDEYFCCYDNRENKKIFMNVRVMKKAMIARNVIDEETVMLELKIRSKIRHPFLINQIFAFQDFDNLYYVTESASNYLLNNKNLPKVFSVKQAKFYIAEIFLCLKHLHSKNHHYTFLCPKSIILKEDGHIKLDFGFCNCIEYNNTGIKENIEYVSPDYIDNNRFSYLSDYWSMGIILYKMVFGFTPFDGETFDETLINLKNDKLVFPDHSDEDIKSFIMMLLDKKIFKSRPSCINYEEQIMKHKLFHGMDWKKMVSKIYPPPFIPEIPNYDLKIFPKLNILYASSSLNGKKDGFGKLFQNYNTVHFLLNN